MFSVPFSEDHKFSECDSIFALEEALIKNLFTFIIYTWKKVREHLLCYEGKLWTNIFLQSKYVLTKLFN